MAARGRRLWLCRTYRCKLELTSCPVRFRRLRRVSTTLRHSWRPELRRVLLIDRRQQLIALDFEFRAAHGVAGAEKSGASSKARHWGPTPFSSHPSLPTRERQRQIQIITPPLPPPTANGRTPVSTAPHAHTQPPTRVRRSTIIFISLGPPCFAATRATHPRLP